MAQHDFSIANQTFPATRTDLNNALEALATLSSGATAPTATYANMLWYDTSNNILKMRTEADDAWIDIGTLNQSTNEFEVANLTELTQTQAEDDTDTTFGLVSGERLGQAVAANAPEGGGMTLLGTLTTTSGTTQTISGLDLTPYNRLYIEMVDVTPSSTGPYVLLEGERASGARATIDSLVFVGLASGSGGNFSEGVTSSASAYSITTATTSFSFTFSDGGTFSAGTIKIYGEK